MKRPLTLRATAEQSHSLEEFGRCFRDWQHELRRRSSRPQIRALLWEEPPLLRRRFARGEVADAWLAASAAQVCRAMGGPAPPWTQAARRIAAEPWFAHETEDLPRRLRTLRDTPAEFKNRNLFTPAVDLPLALRAGRPAKTRAEKLASNAGRQRRFRARRRQELTRLRALVATVARAQVGRLDSD